MSKKFSKKPFFLISDEDLYYIGGFLCNKGFLMVELVNNPKKVKIFGEIREKTIEPLLLIQKYYGGKIKQSKNHHILTLYVTDLENLLFDIGAFSIYQAKITVFNKIFEARKLKTNNTRIGFNEQIYQELLDVSSIYSPRLPEIALEQLHDFLGGLLDSCFNLNKVNTTYFGRLSFNSEGIKHIVEDHFGVKVKPDKTLSTKDTMILINGSKDFVRVLAPEFNAALGS